MATDNAADNAAAETPISAPEMRFSEECMEEIFAAMAEDLRKRIPAHHNRIFRESLEAAKIRAVGGMTYNHRVPVRPGDTIYYTHRTNHGTSRWPWVVREVHCSKVRSVGPSVVITEDGCRPCGAYILAVRPSGEAEE